jgi:CDP-glucose 4,6-dehydratase
MNLNFWKGRKVFLTGHTGFKGSWITLLLLRLGAKVYGYSLKPKHKESIFVLTKLDKKITKSTIANILNLKTLKKEILKSNASIVIHMAAQSLVRDSYKQPIDTFTTNIIGTANVLEAARYSKSVKAIINVTTDKCYENYEWSRAYKEDDRLGGHDPYSSSKACAELVTTAYRKSFFAEKGINIATARAGNVIGGGDCANDRLIPDFFKALNKNEILQIRSPNSVRPWQHVLDPVFGYLVLGEKLINEKDKYAEAWNFGPSENNIKTVSYIVKYISKKFKHSKFVFEKKKQPHEANLLKLDSSKSKSRLRWKNIWKLETALDKTVEWYNSQKAKRDMFSITLFQINSYISDIKNYK